MTQERLSFDGLPPLSQVVETNELWAKKSLGQNFLFDLNITCKIARFIPKIEQGVVIEIGPGPGGLTRALLHAGAAKVVAIEKDRRCLPALQQIADHYPGKLAVIEGDATQQNFEAMGQAPRHLAANLPYNVGTQLLVSWLMIVADNPDAFSSMTLMFQREVAERITAKQGDKHWGRLAVMANWLCRTERLFDLPPEAFTPAPKVTSSVVSLIPKNAASFPAELPFLERVTAAAFGQRRKMLRQSLKSLGLEPLGLCESASVRPDLRAEALDLQDFCRLAEALRQSELKAQ